MNTQVVIALVSVVFLICATIISHIVASVWWASKITTVLGFLQTTLTRLEKHHESYHTKEQAGKDLALQAAQNSDLWKSLGEHRRKIEALEQEIAYIKGGDKR